VVKIRRKVIQIAGSTQLVSLPREWAKKRGIKKGDELDIEEKNNSLIISTEIVKEPKKIVIHNSKYGRFHRNYLSAAYKLGYDEIDIRFDDKKTMDMIHERVPSCIGLEIVNQGQDFCQIKAISEVAYKEFEQVLRKLFLLMKTMQDNSLAILEEQKVERLEELLILEVTNNKLTDFCKRVLNTRGYTRNDKVFAVYLLVTELERIADVYKHLFRFLIGKKIKIRDKTIRYYGEINEMFSQFYELYYKYDKNKIEFIYEEHAKLKTALIDEMINGAKEEIMVFHSLNSALELIYEMTNVYFEINLESDEKKEII